MVDSDPAIITSYQDLELEEDEYFKQQNEVQETKTKFEKTRANTSHLSSRIKKDPPHV